MTFPAITPMPVLRGDSPVLLVGGTFDPVHLAHVELASAARASVAPEAHLLFVPAARSPFKAGGPEASGPDRVAMLRMAIRGLDRAGVWTDELDRAESGEPSYWVVTLRRARALLGAQRRLLFLIGADQATGFARWHEPKEILRLARVVVINRGEIRTRETLGEQLSGSAFGDRLVGAWCDVAHMDISATDVRQALGAGCGEELGRMLDEDVISFIRSRGLYAS